MTPQTTPLIDALRNLLGELELTTVRGRDEEEAFVELKHVLNQRIDELESHASTPPALHPAESLSNAD